MEPNVTAVGAVYSPETGILSVHSLMDYYLHTAKSKGVELVNGTRVAVIEKVSSGYKITTVSRDGNVFTPYFAQNSIVLLFLVSPGGMADRLKNCIVTGILTTKWYS